MEHAYMEGEEAFRWSDGCGKIGGLVMPDAWFGGTLSLPFGPDTMYYFVRAFLPQHVGVRWRPWYMGVNSWEAELRSPTN